MPIIRFTNQITGEAVDHLLWSFGDSTTSTSTTATVDHEYVYTGDYTASLEAWSLTGQYGLKTKVVTVTGIDPVVPITGDFIWNPSIPNHTDFTCNPRTISSGDPVAFTDLSVPTPSSWHWSFGEGADGTSTEQNPTKNINSVDGTYSISLTTTYGSDTTDNITKNNYILFITYA